LTQLFHQWISCLYLHHPPFVFFCQDVSLCISSTRADNHRYQPQVLLVRISLDRIQLNDTQNVGRPILMIMYPCSNPSWCISLPIS
jgi:hypothetical protein